MLLNSPLIEEIYESSFIKEKKYILKKKNVNGFVFVGAEWCGHCKETAPQIIKLSQMAGLTYPVFFIDGAKNKNSDLLSKLSVKGYPTIFIVYNSELTEYKGSRTANDIFAALVKKSRGKLAFDNS